jgi:hypothetical protein
MGRYHGFDGFETRCGSIQRFSGRSAWRISFSA